MLKSLRDSRPKTVISVIQSKCGYCTSNNDDIKRETRERMLRIRYEQKQLFGRVIRDTEKFKFTESAADDEIGIGLIKIPQSDVVESPYDLPVDTSKVPPIKLVHPDREGEFHWLSQSSRIKIFKDGDSRAPAKTKTWSKDSSSTSTPPPSTERTNRSESIDVNKPELNTTKMNNTAIVSAKNFLQQFVINKQNDKQSIPFDETGLKSIISYPLICEKRSTNQLHDLLADVSLKLPSISKVLQATMSESARFALRKWKLNKISELGIDGFKAYEKETLDRGKNFHMAIENYLCNGQIPDNDSPIIKLWQSIDSSLNQLKPKSVLLEQPILHADLKYKGIIDNVSIVNNELCAFEWKTSEKAKTRLNSTYDAPVQLCAYLGALNADPRYDLTVKNGCVVVAYKNGDAANVFNLSEADLRKYWLVWLQRLQEYWIRVRDGTLPDPI